MNRVGDEVSRSDGLVTDTALPIKGNSEGMERSGMEEELPGRVNDLTLNDFI